MLRFALRTGLRTALAAGDYATAACGWKLFILAPRMLLHRPAGQQSAQANELEQRCELFRRGEWLQLLREATEASRAGGNRPGPGTDEQARAARAVQLVQLGELSAAARALTAEPLAPGNADTLSLNSVTLIGGRLQRNCGATNEHIRLLLDDPSDCALLHQAAERLANADVPEQNGRVRALVVGDVFRPLAARVLAQHFAGAFQEACLPYQFGLSTRAGTEGLYKLFHTATELDPCATLLSIDAVGAYDHVSRQAMLEGLRSRPALVALLPFARQFYGSASVYTWLDNNGDERDVVQGCTRRRRRTGRSAYAGTLFPRATCGL